MSETNAPTRRKPFHSVYRKTRDENYVEPLTKAVAQRRTFITVSLAPINLPDPLAVDRDDLLYGAWLHHEIAEREAAGTIARVQAGGEE